MDKNLVPFWEEAYQNETINAFSSWMRLTYQNMG